MRRRGLSWSRLGCCYCERSLEAAVSTCCRAGGEPSLGRLDIGWDDLASSLPCRRRKQQCANVKGGMLAHEWKVLTRLSKKKKHGAERGVFCFGGIYLPKAATAPQWSSIFNKPGKEKHTRHPASVLQSLEKGSKISQRLSVTYINKYCEARWGSANSNSTETTLSVVGQNGRLGDGTHTRKVFPQWPQTTLIPSGWMGSAGWAGCSSGITITGLRLIVRLLLEERRHRVASQYHLSNVGL